MWKLLKRAWSAFTVYLSMADAWTLVKAAFPFASSVFIAVAGVIEQYPTMYVALATLAGFAVTGIGLQAFSQWRLHNSPKFKLRFSRFEMASEWKQNNAERFLKYIQPIFVIDNLASFQLGYSISKIEWEVANRVPDRGGQVWSMGGIIEPKSSNKYRVMRIDLEGCDFSKPMSGRFYLEMKYGLPGKERYEWSRSWAISLVPTPRGPNDPPSFDITWFDQSQKAV